MLHPALSRALATAHIEDLHRAAARRHTIGFARHVAHAPHVARSIAIVRSASTRLRGRHAAPGRRHDTNRAFSSSPMRKPIRRRRPLIGGLKPRESQAGVRRK
jgi:hypothetical protein